MCTLILLLFISLASLQAQAQTLSPSMEKFKQICLDLREAVNSQSAEGVEDVKKRLRKFDRYDSHTKIGGFRAEPDYEGMEDYAGHISFEWVFLDSLLNSDWDMRNLDHSTYVVSRGSGGDVCTEQKVVASGGTLSCTIPLCYGQCELVVIAEKSAPLTLSVLIDGTPEEVTDEEGVCEKIWTLPDGTKEDSHFSITNNSDEALNCIIISN